MTAIVVTALAGWGAWSAFSWIHWRRPVTIFAWRLPSGEIFLAEDPQNPDLQAFAKREHIADVIRPYHTDMEKLYALDVWASKTFPNSNPFPNYPPWNASVILDWIRQGKTGGFCGQYAFVMGQAAQSQGYFPRYVDVASQDNNSGHFTIQIYVPSLRKWVVFEPTWGTYYVDQAGQPLGMMDLHEYATGMRKGKVLEYPSLKPVTAERLHLFYFFRYYLRNNFVSIPVYARADHGTWWFEQYRLAWIDTFTNNSLNATQAIASSNPADFKYVIDVSHPHEVWCKSRIEFIQTISTIPPLKIVKVHMPYRALYRLVKLVFVNDPQFHRLRGGRP
jgi:hypothetical protein